MISTLFAGLLAAVGFAPGFTPGLAPLPGIAGDSLLASPSTPTLAVSPFV